MPLGTVWTPEEDQRLAELVRLHGPKKWSQIAADLNTNKGSKQCRRRWKNFLSLDERKLGSWTPEEDAQLLECHRKHGNKWTLIAREIGGRTDNAVKNRWAALEKKRRMGEDGVFQQPRTSFSRGSSDLLGVRRIITKDQPQRSFTSRQQPAALLDATWMHDSLGAAAAAAAAAGGQLDQGSFTVQAAALGRQPGTVGIPMAKPDLKINIPGATAPELPYSQRAQAAGAEAGRTPKADALTPVEVWLSSGLHGIDQGRGEDDALLSTSQQGAQAAMAGLATPTEEPSTFADLYKYLYGATPAAQQLAAAGVGAAAAAAAAAGQPAPPAPWGTAAPSMPQQQQVPPPQFLPAASGPYVLQQQPQQQPRQLYDQHVALSAPQAVGPPFMHLQHPGRVPLPSAAMHYSQPMLQQQQHHHHHTTHTLSKLSRTVSGYDMLPPQGNMPQPSLPDGMMLRQQLPPPQPHIVPQGLAAGGVAGTGGLMMHSNSAVTTAAGGFQMPPHQQPHRPGHQQHLHMMQQQQTFAHLAPQEGLMQQQTMQPVMPQASAPAPACPPQQWGAEDLKQLLEILGETGVNSGQPLPPQALQHHQQPLCHIDHPLADEKLVEHANNVNGSLTAS